LQRKFRVKLQTSIYSADSIKPLRMATASRTSGSVRALRLRILSLWRHSGHYYGQLMPADDAIAGQQLHGSLSWALLHITDLLAGVQATPTVL